MTKWLSGPPPLPPRSYFQMGLQSERVRLFVPHENFGKICSRLGHTGHFSSVTIQVSENLASFKEYSCPAESQVETLDFVPCCFHLSKLTVSSHPFGSHMAISDHVVKIVGLLLLIWAVLKFFQSLAGERHASADGAPIQCRAFAYCLVQTDVLPTQETIETSVSIRFMFHQLQ